jgi:hypothetical protein
MTIKLMYLMTLGLFAVALGALEHLARGQILPLAQLISFE